MHLRRIIKFPYLRRFSQIKDHIYLLLLLYKIEKRYPNIRKLFILYFLLILSSIYNLFKIYAKDVPKVKIIIINLHIIK